MTDRSANLSLPFIQPSQAQKHVTHNEALVRLDALVQLSVLSATQTEPPATPAPGDRYIVPDGGTGAFSARDLSLALWEGSGWLFLDPAPGWIAWVADSGSQLRFDGAGWVAVSGTTETVAQMGINTTADTVNRLAVSSAASLLSHDGDDHQLKINKASEADTASLLMQSGWSGRAEIGLVGSDDLVFKTSADGTTFQTALTASATTGVVDFPQGATGLTPAALGAPALATLDYIGALAGGVPNGAGHLPSAWNMPVGALRDMVVTPDLPASFSFAGHSPGAAVMPRLIPVDPHQCYQMQAYVRQESVSGDWSAYANADRHQQSAGLTCYDCDGLRIEAKHHLRTRAGGVDSLTTLAAPLSPGDPTVFVNDATGWNDSDSAAEACGILIFGYYSAGGRLQSHYSRIVDHGLFAPAGVDKSAHTITLSAGFPASLANPDNGGTWPVGTPIANTAAAAGSGTGDRLCLMSDAVLATADHWHRARGHIGGIDHSGTGLASNFAPGTAYVAPVFLPNLSNRSGGWSGFPDTGTAQRVWVGGVCLSPDLLAVTEPITTGASSGGLTVHATVPDPATGELTVAPAGPTLTAI